MDDLHDAARVVASVASRTRRTIVSAESVTAGSIATALAAAPDAREWLCGGIVAYQTEMKRLVLGVTAEDVITRECARQMAEGALRISGADLAVSVTGLGGPDGENGHPPGTVFVCVGSPGSLQVFSHRFDGTPAEVVHEATVAALRHLADAARRSGPGEPVVTSLGQ